MKIGIVMVNYRTPDLVIDCLKTLAEEMRDAAGEFSISVFIGDSRSGDESCDRINDFIQSAGLDDMLCYDIGRNGGFAYGNNHGFTTHVLPDPEIEFVHFLNPDTYIRPGAVRRLAAFLRDHPKAGVVGSRLENPDASLRAYAFRFPTPWREFFRGARLSVLERLVPSAPVPIKGLAETREVDWVTGASFMLPRRVFAEVGQMDPGYFLYFEEVDLMARVRKAGYQVWHVAESRVVHLAGQATGMRSGDPPKRLSRDWYQSRFKFFRAHHGWAGAVLANLLFIAGDLIYRGRRRVLGQPIEDPPHLLRDLVAHGFSVPPAEHSR